MVMAGARLLRRQEQSNEEWSERPDPVTGLGFAAQPDIATLRPSVTGRPDRQLRLLNDTANEEMVQIGTLTRCNPSRQLVMSRRRRESNPLDAVLQAAATPCDLSVERVESERLKAKSQKS